MTHGNPISSSRPPRVELLSAARIEQIVGEAMTVLSRVGVVVENAEAVERLTASGATLSADRARVLIPENLVDQCLRTAPDHFVLYDRDGEEVGCVGRDSVMFDPGSAAISIFDFSSGKSVKPKTRDVVEFIAVTDQTSAYDIQSTGIVPDDLPNTLADRFRLFLALVYSRKPVITGTFLKEAFPVMLEMLVAARGGAGELRDKPLAIFDCCPSPPLMWSDLTCQALMDCAANGIPAETVSMPLSGATAPVTLAGSLVQHTAESLSGLVIHQLTEPGAPIVYGGAPAIFDMRKATTPLGAIETMMVDIGYAQIGRSLRLPVHAYMALSDAKSPDYQAGLETAMGAVLAALSGVNIVSGPGILDFVACQSLEKIVLDAEVCSMARRLIDGVSFGDGTAGLDELSKFVAGGGKTFMTTEHTRRNFRKEVYYPSGVIDRGTYGDWEMAGGKSAADRAHEMVQRLLDSPTLSKAPEELTGKLTDIMTADAGINGLASLPEWRIY
jgi:trimethylamine--corrinoid protein Co-methyltransferase